ncbi:MAG TPA: hypothetical protein VFQ45_11705 [Longimicrobium sp.]|nr:hypothetical protein [Longimicrobium sp.]
MRQLHARVQRWALGVGLAVALGFGASQALAEPAPMPAGDRVCGEYSCDLGCRRRGHAGGDCVNGACICWST